MCAHACEFVLEIFIGVCICKSDKYMINLYCLAVIFYSDVVGCSPVTQAVRVRFQAATLVIRFFHLLYMAPNVHVNYQQ